MHATRHGEELIAACRKHHFDLVQPLLKKRNHRIVNYQDRLGMTPLHWASAMGKSNIVTLLLDHGASVHIQKKNGWTPLHTATFSNHRHVVTLLLLHGAHIDRQDNLEWAPLHYAAFAGRDGLVSLLLDQGGRVPIYKMWKDRHPCI